MNLFAKIVNSLYIFWTSHPPSVYNRLKLLNVEQFFLLMKGDNILLKQKYVTIR